MGCPISEVLIFSYVRPTRGFGGNEMCGGFFSGEFIVLSVNVSLLLVLFVLTVFGTFPFNSAAILEVSLCRRCKPLFIRLCSEIARFGSFTCD